ncbi:hypothetical protein GE09DRAFT_369596 [Coniochaeta sp. 2T2.1]|nr:hypothetical protein GE09DRAFT_369596 [Coniochaeta sp. 2T2.1]
MFRPQVKASSRIVTIYCVDAPLLAMVKRPLLSADPCRARVTGRDNMIDKPDGKLKVLDSSNVLSPDPRKRGCPRREKSNLQPQTQPSVPSFQPSGSLKLRRKSKVHAFLTWNCGQYPPHLGQDLGQPLRAYPSVAELVRTTSWASVGLLIYRTIMMRVRPAMQSLFLEEPRKNPAQLSESFRKGLPVHEVIRFGCAQTQFGAGLSDWG